MANHCDYSMRIVGDKEENVKEFVSYLTTRYSYNDDGVCKIDGANHHFFRIFEAYDNEIEDTGTGHFSCVVDGCCAWSIHTCMLDGEHTYFNDFMKNFEKEPHKKEFFKGISLQKACAKLGVEVEIFSKESGAGFMEHFICNKGEMIKEDCYNDYREIETEDGEYIEQGGIEWDFTI